MSAIPNVVPVTVPVIVLGSPSGGDDAAALEALKALDGRADVELVLAGRVGVGLLDLLARLAGRPVVLVDVITTGGRPGELFTRDLTELCADIQSGRPDSAWSSHALGVAGALRLAGALGRCMPSGRFVGIEGRDFEPGSPSPVLREAYPTLRAEVTEAVRALAGREGRACTSTA